jgi:phosphatidylserine/phosphatidylglycerophosphate/cardiolipin synthase-like enzyme
MGSINYSNASMTQNRELGVYITDPASVQALYADMIMQARPLTKPRADQIHKPQAPGSSFLRLALHIG